MIRTLVMHVIECLRRGAVNYLRPLIVAWAARITERLVAWILPRVLSVLSKVKRAVRRRLVSLLPV